MALGNSHRYDWSCFWAGLKYRDSNHHSGWWSVVNLEEQRRPTSFDCWIQMKPMRFFCLGWISPLSPWSKTQRDWWQLCNTWEACRCLNQLQQSSCPSTDSTQFPQQQSRYRFKFQFGAKSLSCFISNATLPLSPPLHKSRDTLGPGTIRWCRGRAISILLWSVVDVIFMGGDNFSVAISFLFSPQLSSWTRILHMLW